MQLPPWPRSAFLACALLALGLIAALAVLASRPSDPFADKARVEAAVGQALRANPALVVEALQAMQRRQGEIEQLRSREAVAANRQALATQIGITGTPAFVIGDHLISGVMELDEMKEAVAALRARQP